MPRGNPCWGGHSRNSRLLNRSGRGSGPSSPRSAGRNNRTFLDLAQTKLGEFQQSAKVDLDGRQRAIADLVQPLKESLARVDGKLQEVEKDRDELFGDRESLEKFAREKYLMKKESEDIFIVAVKD